MGFHGNVSHQTLPLLGLFLVMSSLPIAYALTIALLSTRGGLTRPERMPVSHSQISRMISEIDLSLSLFFK